jgi:PiT family inorganic phosphate transporter
MAATTHIFALIGVPVSTTQAIVGAVIGIGLIHGAQTVKFRMLRNIGVGWVLTPITALILSSAGYAIWGG